VLLHGLSSESLIFIRNGAPATYDVSKVGQPQDTLLTSCNAARTVAVVKIPR
jgi:hypothetical protein